MSHSTKLAAVAVVMIAMMAASLAEARQSSAAAGGIVVAAEGKLVAPWIEKQACVKGTATCKTMIVNTVTNEIAQMGEQLSSRFERTGRGGEVQRAASAMDKALGRVPER